MTARRKMRECMTIQPQVLRVVADPVRSFIVYSLVSEAKTVRQLGLELACPPTRLYYHLQQLQKYGLVFVERTRLVSGIREKHYRAAARELVLDRTGFGDGSRKDEKAQREALLSFVFDQSRVEIARGLEDGRIDPCLRAPEVDSLIAYRNVLKLSPEQAARLYARLHAFWQEYEAVAKAPAAEGAFYAFAVALYPNELRASDGPAAGKPGRGKAA